MTRFSRLPLVALLTLSLAVPLTPAAASAAVYYPPSCNLSPCPPTGGDPGNDDTPSDNSEPFDWPSFIKESGNTDSAVFTIDCSVRAETPTTDDLWLLNVGDTTLPAGTQVRFRVAASGDHGVFELRQDIPAGKALILPAFLSKAVPTGSGCSAGTTR